MMKNDIILSSLDEIKRLQASGGLEKIQSLLSIGDSDPGDKGRNELPENRRIPTVLSDVTQPGGICRDFKVLLHIHVLLSDAPDIGTLELLKNYLEGLPKEVKRIKGLSKIYLYIVYQEYFNIVTWHDYLKSASLWSWDEIISLKKSLPYCNLNAEAIFDLLSRCAVNFPRDHGIYSVATAACEKIRTDSELGKEMDSRLPDILGDTHLKIFFPRFVSAVINENKTVYASKFQELSSWINKDNCAAIMQALGLACPGEPEYGSWYLPLLEAQLHQSNLTRADYISLSGSKQLSYQNVHDFVVEVSRSFRDSNEVFAAVNHLVNFPDKNDQGWFREIAINTFTNPNDEVLHSLNHLVEELKDVNIVLVYELLTRRIEKLGSLNFLKESFRSLISSDPELFRKHLTTWFLSDVPEVHLALRRIGSLGHIPLELSQDVLANLTSSEKLYIGVKILGYVYSKESLQSLVLSLTRSVRPEEETLLESLYTLYDQYIIYNYRTTLDDLRKELAQEKTPGHLRKLYTSLITTYENYFGQLRSIPDLMELKPDTQLTQYLHFYEQRRFDDLMNQKEEKGSLSMMKSVQVKSQKWAIRRENQNVHEVHPLAHYSTSTEFPMGERLNPIFHEKTRRHYQNLRKHEINID